MTFPFYSLLPQLKSRTSRSKQKLLGWRISICKQRVVGQSSKVCLYARYLMISYVPGCRVGTNSLKDGCNCGPLLWIRLSEGQKAVPVHCKAWGCYQSSCWWQKTMAKNSSTLHTDLIKLDGNCLKMANTTKPGKWYVKLLFYWQD